MMWNQRSLCPPPTNSFKVTLTFQLKEKLLIAQKQLRGGKPVLSNHLAVLNSEQYVQDRLIYKLSSQFRSEKSMKNLKQARVCLNRLKETDIQRQLTEISAAFDMDIEEAESDAYLPSRQMLQYYLVRLMSAAALLSRTCCLTYNTYIHAKQVMEVGNMLPANTLLIAMAARIWVTCKSLRSYVCGWYQALFPLLEYLQATPVPWLKSEGTDLEDQLPTFLFDWLQSQFGMDVSPGEDSVISKTGQVDLNSGLEEKIDTRTESVTTGNTEDIGVPIQRKRKEPVIHSDQILVTKFAKTIDDMQHTCQPFMKNINTHISESVNNHQNELGESKPSKKKNHSVSSDVTDKKKLRKCLRKKLKSISDIIKCLGHIQDSDILNVGKYELVITKTLREKCKEMLATCIKHGDGREVKASDFDNNTGQMLKKKLIVKLLKLDRQKRPQVSKQKISGVGSKPDVDNQQDDSETDLEGLSQHLSGDYPHSKTKFEEKFKKVKLKKKVKVKKKGKKTNVKGSVKINDLNEIARTNIELPQEIPDNGKNALKEGKVKNQEKGKEKRTSDKSKDTILETVSEFALRTKETKWKRKRKAVDADADLKDTAQTNVISSKLKGKQEDSVTESRNKRAKLSADMLEYKDRTIQNTSKLETVGKASNNIDGHKVETRKVKKKKKHQQAKLHKPTNKAKIFEKRNAHAMTKDTNVRQLKQNNKKNQKRKN